MNNYAFIDSQNLNLSIKQRGWKIDYKKFRKYLKEKYSVTKAFLFLGYIADYNDLYKSLQEAGFICIFKPTLNYKDGKTKGNCDAELVLQTMIEYRNYKKAVIITGDGDFHCLVQFLIQQKKLHKLLIPDSETYSALLKRFDSGFIAFISDLKSKISYKAIKYKKT